MERGGLACWFLLCAVCLVEARPRFYGLAPMKPRSITVNVSVLPECTEQSACAYVQLNLAGINAEQLCRCPDGLTCPLDWDPLDGRTVSHGNDQYKYCRRAPRLQRCMRDEVVYSTSVQMLMLTGIKLENTARLYCSCPPTHVFYRNQTSHQQYDNGLTVIHVNTLCKRPPTCEPVEEDACMAISENFLTGAVFVKRDCACPAGMRCPTDPDLAANRVQLNKGTYYLMNCLPEGP
ncbi:U-scoloptoxin(11)-Sm5a-like isoform X1 [Haemaphysalis longicornis]